MKKFALIMALLLVIAPFLVPSPALASGWEGPTAQKGDIAIGTSSISTDTADGKVSMKLYLEYKGSTLFTESNLSFFELSPVVSDASKFPFEITWSSWVQHLSDQKQENAGNTSGNAMGANKRYFQFDFQRKADLQNGYYPIEFKVRFLNAGQNVALDTPIEDTITVYVQINNGKPVPTESPSPTPAPEATPKPQAKVILKNYTLSTDAITGGENFEITMTLENTSKRNVTNMECNLSEANGLVLPESGSNTFFIDKIPAGETYEITLPLKALPDAGLKPVNMTLAMSYNEPDAVTASSTFSLPIHQVMKLTIDEPYVPSDVYVDEQFDISLAFYNTGKATLYNTMVTLESDTMKAEESYFVGTMEPGAQARYEAYVTISSDRLQYATPSVNDGMDGFIDEGQTGEDENFTTDEDAISDDGAVGTLLTRKASAAVSVIGGYGGGGYYGGGGGSTSSMVCSGTIVISYEDNMGQLYRKEIPVEVSVMSFDMAYGNDDAYMPYYDPETGYMIDPLTGEYLDPVTMMPIQRGLAPWIIIAIVAGGVILVVTAIIVIRVVLKNKRKKMEMEMENEVE